MTKISNYFNYQYTLLCLSIIALLQTSVAFSYDKIENLPLSKLGGFETKLSTIKKVDLIEVLAYTRCR